MFAEGLKTPSKASEYQPSLIAYYHNVVYTCIMLKIYINLCISMYTYILCILSIRIYAYVHLHQFRLEPQLSSHLTNLKCQVILGGISLSPLKHPKLRKVSQEAKTQSRRTDASSASHQNDDHVVTTNLSQPERRQDLDRESELIQQTSPCPKSERENCDVHLWGGTTVIQMAKRNQVSHLSLEQS